MARASDSTAFFDLTAQYPYDLQRDSLNPDDPSLLSCPSGALDSKESGLSDMEVCVLVRTCYEQWGKWRNYHLFRIFSTFKNEKRVQFSVELVLPKMALEISIDGQLVYSRLMKTGYLNYQNLAEYINNQISCALNRSPLNVTIADKYNNFLSQFRRRMSNCMDQADMNPGEDTSAVTTNTTSLEKTMSLQNKGRGNGSSR